MKDENSLRPGERRLENDPGAAPADAGVVFIGRLHTPWKRGDCPRNLGRARELGGRFTAEIDAPFRPGLEGLVAGDAVILLYWMADARRDLIRQAPHHAPGPKGTFALRSPVRPNPVALAVTRLTALDADAGRLEVEALDAYDGTPLLDVKPYRARIDVPPGGTAGQGA